VAVAPDLERELRSLLDYPAESAGTEIKDWLDLTSRVERANVARELIALANHGGGNLLFGFAETSGGWESSGECTYDLARYSQDEINNVLKAHAEPVFECSTYHLDSTAGTRHVIVVVPGGHRTPIRSRGAPAGSRLVDHCYYIRRQGPASAPPDSGADWQELIERCMENNRERQLEGFRRVLEVLRTEPTLAQEVTDLASGQADPLLRWAQESMARLDQLGGPDDG
jgi:predicted HTH transcriptional regulator